MQGGEDDYGRNDPNPADFEALEQLKALEGLSPEQLLKEAHVALLRDLLAKLKLGQASHQELAILRNMLRDNGMMLMGGMVPGGSTTPQQAPLPRDEEDLPDFQDGE